MKYVGQPMRCGHPVPNRNDVVSLEISGNIMTTIETNQWIDIVRAESWVSIIHIPYRSHSSVPPPAATHTSTYPFLCSCVPPDFGRLAVAGRIGLPAAGSCKIEAQLADQPNSAEIEEGHICNMLVIVK